MKGSADFTAVAKFRALCGIVRAQHFAWREAVRRRFPRSDPAALVDAMWEITGRRTAEAYLKRIDPARPLAPQVASCVAWSSRCMGERASARSARGGREAFVRHAECPWYGWHRKLGLLREDRRGCDRWFESTVKHVNRRLGTRLRVETLEALPSGGASCLRRLWVEG